jgi:hypothetical protein
LAEGDGWVIYEEAALVKSSGQSSEPAGQLPTKVTAEAPRWGCRNQASIRTSLGPW